MTPLRRPESPLTRTSLTRASLALARRDAALGAIRERLGPPPLWPREPGFGALILMILEQQVSLASARAAYDRLVAEVGELSPASLTALDDATLRAVGFSRQKTGYARGLAAALLAGTLDLDRVAALDDDAARGELVALKGIGPWTADCYLLMCLRRRDVWPAGDLALQEAARDVLGLAKRPSPEELTALAKRWRPWRSVAARMLWQQYRVAP